MNYTWSPAQRDWAVDMGAASIVAISPIVLLDLTTDSEAQLHRIIEESAPFETYASLNMIVAPFLRLDRETGEHLGHEGRHRAAALYKASPGELFQIALLLHPRRRGSTFKDAPPLWRASRGYPRYDVARLLGSNKMRVIDFGPL